MKVLLLLLFIPIFTFAQHCPFDGATLIVVKLTDKKGKAIKNAKFTLREIENENAESCSFAKGLLNKPFEPTRNVLGNLYEGINVIEKYCADCNFLGDGFYAAKLNQAEKTCIIKNSNNHANRIRKFEIGYGEKKYLVKESEIYHLCTNAGKWSRIEPIVITAKINSEDRL
jgi:hypothetical protein